MSYLKLEAVSKEIKHEPVLKNISLEIAKGTISGFVGENGSGKTMLFRAILGFIKINHGTITIAENPVGLNSEIPVNIGTIIETPGFINAYTALNNLKYLAAIKNLVTESQIIETMKVFDLDKLKDTRVKKFSLGMRQKLAIIQAFMENQDLLVLDEPTNGLDTKAVQIFEKKMLQLREAGKTILIASHDQQVIRDIADNIYQLDNGSLKQI